MFTRRLWEIIDRWDEVAAAADDQYKRIVPFVVDAQVAFPDLPPTVDHLRLADAARETTAKPNGFYEPQRVNSFSYDGQWLSFLSTISTEDPNNSRAYARVFEKHRRRDAVILVQHWNSKPEALWSFATLLNKFGFTAIVLVLPYHHQRKRSGSDVADYFLSANLGRTIRSVRQAVVDLRGVVDWLEDRGYRRFQVVGASLGSCIAGLAGAFDPRIEATALLLTAGSFADVVWTGRATRHISAALRSVITLKELREVWSIISLDPFVRHFRDANHRLLVLSAARDQVVLPQYTSDFIRKLREADVAVQQSCFPCGHYSLAMFPFNICACARVIAFLRSTNARD